MASAIDAARVSKEYRLRHRPEPTTLRDAIARGLRLRSRHDGHHREASRLPTVDVLRALDDVSFQIPHGTVTGIIGPNGAGKSTLLKILSRIVEPTSGHVGVSGRVGSLLEVGTGFHPELTGRENVFLNGAILGMRRAEITASLDEIFAFAEVQRFADTPVKHYSSGMYLRLAFAVAVHLRPQILIIDEVLAVGDAQFQKRCLAKMQQVSLEGRTVLFVSHNLSAIRHICTRGLALEQGRLVDEGPVNQVIDRYLARAMQTETAAVVAETDLFDVEAVEVMTGDSPVIKTFDNVTITVRLRARRAVGDPGLYVGILSLDHQRLAGLDFKDFATATALAEGDRVEMQFQIAELPLMPGSYHLDLHVKDMATQQVEFVPRTFSFDVAESPVYEGRKLDQWFGWIGLRARVQADHRQLTPV